MVRNILTNKKSKRSKSRKNIFKKNIKLIGNDMKKIEYDAMEGMKYIVKDKDIHLITNANKDVVQYETIFRDTFTNHLKSNSSKEKIKIKKRENSKEILENNSYFL